MKIIYLASGAAGMYCGMCLHDNTLAAAMLRAGEDVMLVPTYTPLRTDETNVSAAPPMLFGGINVYLQQKSALFRRTPWILDRLLDNKSLINLVTKFAPSVDAAQLGPMTVAMLEGDRGPLVKEHKKLIAFLEHEKPDVVHLSNAMLLGMAGAIRRAVRAPIVCSLSGEDIFLEKLPPPHYDRARRLLRDRAGEVDAFTSLNAYFADFMTEYMNLDRRRVHVIPHGLNLTGHAMRPSRGPDDPFTIGYFAHVCPEKGLHLLVEAFRRLFDRPNLPPIRLVAAGYLGKEDRPFLEKLQTQLREWGLDEHFEYRGEPDRDGKIAVLRSFDVMSVPAIYRESKGLSILEALANGVPVVQPAHGSYPEMVRDTGGGLLCEPENPLDLADKLESLIRHPERAAELGRLGHEAVHARYSDQVMAQRTIGLYRRLIDDKNRPAFESATVDLPGRTIA